MDVDIGSGALKKWLKFEAKWLHESLIIRRKSLEELLRDDEPSCMTKDNRKHVFNKDVLQRIGQILPQVKHSKFMLPINIYIDMKVENQCYIEDENAADVLRELEDFGQAYRYMNGRMWLPLSLAAELVGKHKTVIQMVFLI